VFIDRDKEDLVVGIVLHGQHAHVFFKVGVEVFAGHNQADLGEHGGVGIGVVELFAEKGNGQQAADDQVPGKADACQGQKGVEYKHV